MLYVNFPFAILFIQHFLFSWFFVGVATIIIVSFDSIFIGSFIILVYTDKETAVPMQWAPTDAHTIANPQQVHLRSFDTKIHKVNASVSYRK